ncbi:unnamed protein product [Coregonus sp. 'balchen']|nr:unnamed protein product [Coregonus sp. 'balchen']
MDGGPVEKHKHLFKEGKCCCSLGAFQDCWRTPVRPETDELGDLLTGIIDSQQPLEGIPDDDHLDSLDGGPFQFSFEADDHHSLEGIREDEGQPATSAAARRKDCVTNPGWRTKTKRLSMHEKLAMEFHVRKLI